jgi:hypothetical protein
MADVTVAAFEQMDPIYDGLARRARATLGVTSLGMQVMTLPANWDGYPDHRHDASVEDANQEEVYIPIEGSATLRAGEERFALRPGMMVRVGRLGHSLPASRAALRRSRLPTSDRIVLVTIGAIARLRPRSSAVRVKRTSVASPSAVNS